MKILYMLVLAFLVSACATSAKRTNRISVGMSKMQVMDIMGDPDNTRGVEGETHLLYDLSPKAPDSTLARVGIGVITLGWSEVFYGKKEPFVFVFDKSDTLRVFGKQGDFGTTRDQNTIYIKTDEKK